MEKRLFLITGSPGSGKTTVLWKIIQALKGRGCSVGGMVSREVRRGGSRVGFEVLDLSSGRTGWLAHINQKRGPRVGKYRVNLKDLDSIGADAIANAVKDADVIAIDEIGPMELHSEQFQEAVRRAMESRKLVVGTVHWRARNRLITEIKSRKDTEMHRVTYENRENIHKKIVEKAEEFLAPPT